MTGCCRSLRRRIRSAICCGPITPLTPDSEVPIVIGDSAGPDRAEVDRYAADLSRVAEVDSVSAPSGTYVGGRLTGPPMAPVGEASGSTLLTVGTSLPLFSTESETQLTRLHEVSTPGGRAVEFGGLAQTNRDSVHAITSRLPLVLGLIALIMLVLLFYSPAAWCFRSRRCAEHAVAVGGVRRHGLDLPRMVTSARWAPRPPGHSSPTCRCCCSAWRSACRWITRCSSFHGSANSG